MNSTTAKKLSAILASIALVLTGTLFTGVSPSAAATQPRGEVNYGPLRFPTPKQVGLGNGWKVKTAAIGTGNYVSKSCRVATKCTVLSWAGPSKIGIFQTAAFRMSKPDVKFLVDNYKRQAREKKSKSSRSALAKPSPTPRVKQTKPELQSQRFLFTIRFV